MTKYNPDAKCPKCGFEKIDDFYWHEELIPSYYTKRGDHGYHIHLDELLKTGLQLWQRPLSNQEHIARSCMRCKYCWSELPLDVKLTEKEEKHEKKS